MFATPRGFIVLAPLALLLAGCSSGPAPAEVQQTFLVELRAQLPGDPTLEVTEEYFGDFAAEIAGDMIEDDACGSFNYRTVAMVEDHMRYAYEITCLSYFEDDMSPAQIDAAKQMLLDSATEDVLENQD